MVMVLIAIFIVISLLELSVGVYFAHGYLIAVNNGLTTLGPAWQELTNYWLLFSIIFLVGGCITFYVSIKSWRQRRLQAGTLMINSLLFILFLYLLGKLF